MVAPQNRFHTRQQLNHFKWFCNVIISTCAKPFHTVIQFAHRRNKNNGCFFCFYVFQQFISINFRKHDIKKNQIVIVFLDTICRLQSVHRLFTVISSLCKTHFNQIRNCLFIFHNQYLCHLHPPYHLLSYMFYVSILYRNPFHIKLPVSQ